MSWELELKFQNPTDLPSLKSQKQYSNLVYFSPLHLNCMNTWVSGLNLASNHRMIWSHTLLWLFSSRYARLFTLWWQVLRVFFLHQGYIPTDLLYLRYNFFLGANENTTSITAIFLIWFLVSNLGKYVISKHFLRISFQ